MHSVYQTQNITQLPNINMKIIIIVVRTLNDSTIVTKFVHHMLLDFINGIN